MPLKRGSVLWLSLAIEMQLLWPWKYVLVTSDLSYTGHWETPYLQDEKSSSFHTACDVFEQFSKLSLSFQLPTCTALVVLYADMHTQLCELILQLEAL